MYTLKSLLIIFYLLGVESKFGAGIGRVEWLDDEKLWSLIAVDGQNLGQFKGVVASDKNIVSLRIAEVTGRSPPLGKKCWRPFFVPL